jgi:hypothetical protein
MTYNFYLKDAATSGAFWGEGTCFVLGNEIKRLFDEVCALPACKFSSSDYWWDPATVDDKSLLIYFVDGHSDSKIRNVNPRSPLGPGGTTHISSAGNLSEVYVSAASGQADPARALAVLAFHEAMHNLLKMGNRLHGVGGMGLAAETIFSNSALTARNKALLAPVMGTAIKQNTSFL